MGLLPYAGSRIAGSKNKRPPGLRRVKSM